MRETQEPRRIGPFRLATELLAFVERQLDAVRRDLGPRVAGWARLAVVALTAGFLWMVDALFAWVVRLLIGQGG